MSKHQSSCALLDVLGAIMVFGLMGAWYIFVWVWLKLIWCVCIFSYVSIKLIIQKIAFHFKEGV